ncbi:MAG: recombinase family protein [Planctomycetes bacterium]|nr:recombinase family protein [Planctomycetota bacterium]
MAKAIAYLRVSSAKQARDGKDGFPRQRTAIRAYCQQKRIELVEEHTDAGVSGTVPLEGREGLSTALSRCSELGAEVLLVEKIDRLGRDLIVSEMAVRAFGEAGVGIVVVDSGEDLRKAEGDPSRKLIRQVLAAVAEYEKSALVAKLRAARDRKRRNGGHSVGCYRFGEHPDRPDELETLARIRALRRVRAHRDRRSLADIAEALNREARESRSGRPWSASMVRDVLRD